MGSLLRRSACSLAVTIVFVAAAGPARASAQVVEGVVVDDQSLAPVAGVTVHLVISASLGENRVTDDDGRFFLPLPRRGEYQLEVAGFGYRTTRSQSFRVERNDTLSVEFRVLPDAILLEPLTVTGRSNLGRHAFERRRTEWGQGVFLTPAQIDSIAPRHPADVFRKMDNIALQWGAESLNDSRSSRAVPYIHSTLGRRCLVYMVNSVLVRPGRNPWTGYQLSGLNPADVVAVEVYRSAREVPPELGRQTHQNWFTPNETPGRPATLEDITNCGIVVIWTNHGW
jgi:hypothetical protein